MPPLAKPCLSSPNSKNMLSMPKPVELHKGVVENITSRKASLKTIVEETQENENSQRESDLGCVGKEPVQLQKMSEWMRRRQRQRAEERARVLNEPFTAFTVRKMSHEDARASHSNGIAAFEPLMEPPLPFPTDPSSNRPCYSRNRLLRAERTQTIHSLIKSRQFCELLAQTYAPPKQTRPANVLILQRPDKKSTLSLISNHKEDSLADTSSSSST